MPLNTKVSKFATGPTAHRVAEGSAKPLSQFSAETLTVTARKITVAIVVTNEVLRLANGDAEMALGNDLVRAAVAEMDIEFADPNIGGSIANGATTISSSCAALGKHSREIEALRQGVLELEAAHLDQERPHDN